MRVRRTKKGYIYLHLGYIGEQVEKQLIENSIVADKSITLSKCWSFRVERDKYDIKLLESIYTTIYRTYTKVGLLSFTQKQ